MTERPVIFSGPMVRAILEGRKTQTRRVVKPQPSSGIEAAYKMPDGRWQWLHLPPPAGVGMGAFAAAYRPGDVLWVRETFYIDLMPWDTMRLPEQRPAELDDRDIYYRADGECCQQIPECSCAEVGKPRWRPSIHMRRWAARLFLRVEAVRIERLRDISESDAKAEGVTRCALSDADLERFDRMKSWPELYRPMFRMLWDSLNAKRGYGWWNANPWVWVIEFERIQDYEEAA